ncbi:T9SS type A sorting domain-containing protein [bacterium]|nr:T9SS type A sorting domain-containing protein [bacterium]
MKFFSILFFSISFLIANSYSWEDGGTVLGSFGNLANVANVGSTNGIDPHDGDYMLTVSEDPIDGTPQAFLAWVTDISDGDEITACFYGYDDTASSSPSMRVWGSWTDGSDINAYGGTAGGNEDYTAGTGWDEVCHTFTTDYLYNGSQTFDAGEGLVIQARLYSSSSASEAVQYFIDSIEITTTSATATIQFPGAQDPVEGPIADAGDDQTVDAGSIVMLDGSGSYHTDGTIAEYYWEQVDNSGFTVLLDDEESAMPTFIAPNETTTLSFDLSVSDTAGDQSSDTVTISVIASAGALTIAEIQGQTDTSPYVDQYVSTSGIVTAVVPGTAAGFFIQDNQDLWSGLWVIDFGSNVVNIGDLVEVSGVVEEWYDLTQINIANDGSSFTLSDTNQSSYNPIVTSNLSEEHESMLVTVSGTCSSLPTDANYGEWTLDNEGTEIMIQNNIFDFMPEINEAYTITGPATYTYSNYKVYPRDNADIQEGILSNTELIQNFSILEAYPNPFNPTLTIKFSALNTELIEVSIYDIMGHKVEDLFSKVVESNQLQTLSWDASNYSSGDYLIHLKSGNQFKTHKITLIK